MSETEKKGFLDSIFENGKERLLVLIAAAILSGGVSYGTTQTAVPVEHNSEIRQLQREMDQLRTRIDQESENRKAMVREAVRSIEYEIRRSGGGGGSFGASSWDFMMDAPAAAAEAPESESAQESDLQDLPD